MSGNQELEDCLLGLLDRMDTAKRRLLVAVLDLETPIGEQQRLVAKASGVALARDYVREELARVTL